MKLNFKKYLLIVIMCFTVFSARTQNTKTIDSLLLVLVNAKEDTVRCVVLNELITAEYDEKIWSKYNKQLLDISAKNLKSTNNNERKFFLSCYAVALNNFGYLYEKQGDIFNAFECFNKSLPIQYENHDTIGMAGSLLNLGMIFRQQGNIPKALEYYHRALKLQIKINNKSGIATSYNNIGFVYDSQGEYLKAFEYYNKALNINKEIDDKVSIAICYSNIAFLYNSQSELFFTGSKTERMKKGHIKAIEYLNNAIKLQEEVGDKEGIASSMNSLGNLYETYGDPFCTETTAICYEQGQQKALDCYIKALELREEINNKVGIAISYESLSSLMLKQNKINESFKYANLSLKVAKELGFPENIKDAAILLKNIHEKRGEYKNAIEMYELYIQMRDSIVNHENKKAIYKKQFQIEYEIKATKDSLAHEQAIKQQRMYTFGGLAGFLLMVVVAGVSYYAFKNKKKANILLKQKNIEINNQKEEISTQRDEIEAQRDLVTIQKEEIEEIHKEVTDSINYAKRIQEALLPVSDSARSLLGEHFILFKPKNIVSGDFYWAIKINNFLIVAVADCTGHGVPGAFMSMLGISFLNEIVQKQEINKANHILNQLRLEIINALQQKGVHGEQKDGMDISLLVVNVETNEAQWAGANNPLYIISSVILNGSEEHFSCEVKSNFSKIYSSTTPLNNNYRLIELKGDKMPIAIYPLMNDFINHEFKLNKGDSVYLFTDGYADQFGGPKGRKFMYKQFKEVLINISNYKMQVQKEILEKAFEEWKDSREQIDDVTVMGLKI
ncbi:MAG: tetratricopeptide repeat protein [Bacteroidia bacterium]|nr:tetratricopeptide repeat protein [Bacteroidia bacterium]